MFAAALKDVDRIIWEYLPKPVHGSLASKESSSEFSKTDRRRHRNLGPS
jgi:hypothetical protein